MPVGDQLKLSICSRLRPTSESPGRRAWSRKVKGWSRARVASQSESLARSTAKRGISLDEFMYRIEQRLADYRGYLVLFVDEADNVLRDRKTFFTFLIRRLPQRIPSKLILIFASNRLDWLDELDPRVKSFLKVNELVFRPYDAVDLQHILRIRVEKRIDPMIKPQSTVAQQVAQAVMAFQQKTTGQAAASAAC